MNISFKELNLLEQTQMALDALNFENPTPIQALVIPEMVKGFDIIAQSQTGTGKTFSFVIPIIEKIKSNVPQIQSLILCPTRELALQVFHEVKKLVKFHPAIRSAVIYGGESYIKQFQALDNKPHIVIATPGRIIDLLERKKINLSTIKILTLDEADEMLKMGFKEALETILADVPENRQTVLFSATMPLSIKQIASKYQKDPKIIKVAKQNISVQTIEQFYFLVHESDKNKLLIRFLDQKNPDSVIIFVNTKKSVDTILYALQTENFLVDSIHGDLKQNQRQYVMNNFRKKNIKILVATDVAARGIDISDITMIINYDLPHECEVYVHRIGRTGRAGKKGLAYSFVNLKQMGQLKRLQNYLKTTITALTIPTIEEVKKDHMLFYQQQLTEAIAKNINKITENNDGETLADILLDKFDAKQIIMSLLNQFMPLNKKYEFIAEPRFNRNFNNSFRDNSYSSYHNSRKNDYKSHSYAKNNMIELAINLGREDGINPLLFLKILNSKFQIYSHNVGNIKHFYNKTIFEVTQNLVPQLKAKKNIYFEKKLLQISCC